MHGHDLRNRSRGLSIRQLACFRSSYSFRIMHRGEKENSGFRQRRHQKKNSKETIESTYDSRPSQESIEKASVADSDYALIFTLVFGGCCSYVSLPSFRDDVTMTLRFSYLKECLLLRVTTTS